MLRLTYSTLIVSAMLAMLLFGAMPAKSASAGSAATGGATSQSLTVTVR